MNKKTALGAVGLLLGVGVGLSLRARLERRRYSLFGRTVVITGGSRGLGLVMARRFAQEGAHLALLARDENELRRAEAELTAQGTAVLTIPCDIRNREQVEAAILNIAIHYGSIDVLINNAGIIQMGPLDSMTVEDFEDAMATHYFGPLYATLAALPHLRRGGGGRIVNIASIAGKVAVPHLASYSASKFALVGFSDALRAELRREHIFVTTVCPGLLRTGSAPNAKFKGNFRREYAWFALSASLPLLSHNAERSARKIMEACRRGSPRLLLGLQTKAASLLNELFPGTTARLMALVNWLLPTPDKAGSKEIHVGWESGSAWVPSVLTRLTEQAALKNNEARNG